MLNDLRIEKLTRQGITLMQEERALALRGDFGGLEELGRKKEEFLRQMEELAQSASETGPLQLRESRKQELETLFGIIRRRAEENQHILRAAQAGVKGASRSLSSLLEETGSLGVYSSTGEPITNENSTIRTSGVY